MRFSGNFFGKSCTLRQLGKIDTFENHRKPRAGDLDGLVITGHCRKAKGACFEPLVPDRKTITVPVEDFHEIMLAIEKNEEMVAERIGFESIADDAEQSFEGLSHINGRGAERNAGSIFRQW